ncbi:MAG: DegT/DnrJ/EryC1/StrS family aminotransferase [Brevinema sp.]
MIPFVDLQAQYQAYKSEIDARIQGVLERNDFILGKDVKELEQWMSDYTQRHAVAISSGTDAIMVPLYAMDLKEGDEIITTPFTFFATAEVISFLKLKPVFVDIDPETCNIDHNKIEQVITSRTKGIISVSLFGQTPDIDAIEKIAKKYGLFHFEDAAQSFGAIYKGRRSCGLTDIASTSFFPAKSLGTYGDGGMMYFKDKDFAEKCFSIINQGQRVRYEHQYIGMNSRFDTLKAAVLMAKLTHYDDELHKREEIAGRYTKAFQQNSIDIVKRSSFMDRHARAQFTLVLKNRDQISNELNKRGIPTAIHYPKPLHLQQALLYLNYHKGSFPVAEAMAEKVLSIPIHPFLQKDTQDMIIENVLDLVNKV